jgi:cobalt/nickel transport system permease protein
LSDWLERTAAGVAGSIERAVFTEEHARRRGWLQGLDPRAKLVAFLVVALTAGFLRSLAVLLALYAAVLAAALASRAPLDLLVRRVWTGVPLFAGIVVVPSLFLGRPPYLVAHVSVPAIWSALVFVARVGVSVSVAVLLVLTTPWADLLKALHAVRVPLVFVLVLSMTYRYVFLFLHALTGRLEARRSRVVAATGGGEQRAWIAGGVGALMDRSFQLGGEVYSAMLARGFTGEVRTLSRFRLRRADGLIVIGSVLVAAIALTAARLLP